MRKIIYLFVFVILIYSCNKLPEPDNPNFVGFSLYSNYYILTNISTRLAKRDALDDRCDCYKYINKNDTVSYDSLYIVINLNGKMIAENIAYTEESEKEDTLPPGYPRVTEQKFFINKIQNFNIYTNSKLLNYSDFTVFFKDKRGHYISKSYYKEPLGYSPLKIYFNSLPELNKKIQFKIEIEDDKGNVFSAVTDSVFVTD